ncbi:MAG: FAD-binding oxidoreductase [Rhodobacteraceae bacterium]|nr:FAD-binding oxidoreductase [Paracoccaceae bacterium]
MTSALSPRTRYDVIIVGGGFYGCALALLFRSITSRVLLIEKEGGLLRRASAVNQARVHSGLHYPRNFPTARRSLRNFPLFVNAFSDAVDDSFTMLYAIARRRSMIRANRFATIFREMGSDIRPATAAERGLFDSREIEDVFAVSEFAFDWTRLRDRFAAQIDEAGIPLRLETTVDHVAKTPEGDPEVILADGERISAGAVFNVTYGALNSVLTASGLKPYPVKYELAEVALVDPPEELAGLGVTVMDGPFFSAMPFPAEGAYSLTHVRFTPHLAWTDAPGRPDAYSVAAAADRASRWRQMVADGRRYLPCLDRVRWRRSLYDVKAVMIRNENDDGRPIQLVEHAQFAGLYTVLGGKIDNIFDLAEILPSLRPEWQGLSQGLLVA